jgi:hypothetical protein
MPRLPALLVSRQTAHEVGAAPKVRIKPVSRLASKTDGVDQQNDLKIDFFA